jgi:hypothetical protein
MTGSHKINTQKYEAVSVPVLRFPAQKIGGEAHQLNAG